MLLLQVSDNNFWYDHGVGVASATATFLAFLLTFITLIINSRKEKEEAEDKSQKTLAVLDFIFENNNDELKGFLEQIKYIRDNTDEGVHSVYIHHYSKRAIEEWKKTRDSKANLFFHIELKDLSTGKLEVGQHARTRFENNYITLETYRYLEVNGFSSRLDNYENELKINLKNQHLNITSNSLEKISGKIHAIKESRNIFDSIRLKDLVKLAMYEPYKTEEEISEIFEEHPLDFINEDHQKVLQLEEVLQEVVKPLSDDSSF